MYDISTKPKVSVYLRELVFSSVVSISEYVCLDDCDFLVVYCYLCKIT